MNGFLSFVAYVIMAAFVAMPILAVGFAAGVFFRRRRLGQATPLRTPQDDLANMMILFQTMRDILDQQKELARQLNQSIDKKIIYIRQCVDGALDDITKVRDIGRQLSSFMEETRADLTSVQRQIEYLKTPAFRPFPDRSETPREIPAPGAGQPSATPPAAKATPTPGTAAGARTGAPPFPMPPTHEPASPPPRSVFSEESPIHSLSRPSAPIGAKDFIDSWGGAEFGGDISEPLAFETPDTTPETPENAEAARNAFRALLNIETDNATPPKRGAGLRAAESRDKSRVGNNGRGFLTPLQARVYEYSDAGMTVQQIAQEIGLGKGEIRLILSLRKDKGR